MSGLEWKKQTDRSWWAMRDQHVVGFVVEREPGDVVYQIRAMHTKWICKGYGEVKSIQTGKRAIERAWRDWLDAFGLREAENP